MLFFGLLSAMTVQMQAAVPWLSFPQFNGIFKENKTPKEVNHKFFCTVYYTPRETGFQEKLGFDLHPESRKGLGNYKFPRDFLRAVEKEGFGRLKTPIEGKQYIYYNGKWGFAVKPTGSKDDPLRARYTCAVSSNQKVLSWGEKLLIRSDSVMKELHNREWQIEDRGKGLDLWQIDLYWGEDDPMGPDRLVRPKGTTFEHAFDVELTVLN
jgi:hypothetical protein